MTKIFLDPGHGGHDPGATGNGLVEKDLVLQIGLETRRILQNEYSGVQVRMSRTTDVFVGLNQRAKMAVDWGADGFISIHLNAATSSANGTETFMHTNSNLSGLRNNLNSNILSELRKLGDMNNRGLKSANFAVLRGTYRHMKTALTEALFLTNSNNASIMKKSNAVQAIARGHAKGIAAEFNLKGGSSSSGSTSSGSSSSGSSAPKYNGQSFAQAHSDWWMKKRSETEEAQRLLNQHGYNLAVDGILGQQTLNAVRDYQDKHGISYNGANFYGVPGPATRKHLRDNSSSSSVAKPTLRNGSRGNEVTKLQRQLNNHSPRFNPRGVDGIYGANTADAVLRYQKYYGVKPYDGIYGQKTASKLKETI